MKHSLGDRAESGDVGWWPVELAEPDGWEDGTLDELN
jgi:hypothetical protein